MENQRLILFLAAALIVLLLWEAWQAQYGPRAPEVPPAPAVTQPAPGQAAPPADVPQAEAPATTQRPGPAAEGPLASGQRIVVRTDLLEVAIDTMGGDLREARLLAYPLSTDQPEPFPLMDDELPRLYVAQSGLLSKRPAPDHHALYTAEQTVYELGPREESIVVPLVWTGPDGLQVVKTYTFYRNQYVVDVDHKVVNNSTADWQGRAYRQFQRTEYEAPGKSALLYTFTGAAISTPEDPYTKIEFSEMDDWRPDQSFVKDGWAAMLQHYFVTAWIPPTEQLNHYYTRAVDGTRFIVGVSSAEQAVPAGQELVFPSRLYLGPKDQDRMEAAAKNLRLTVDYGIMTFLAQPLFWLLQQIHKLVNNWGWAIVLLTLLIKLVFYKLSESSYRSMANMRRMAPKFQAIRERYGEDRQRMSQAMMELYKKEKVNPLSGCWPILVQMPVFLALYWVLLESVELRQADWILWIHDLSTKDPFYVLPVLMGASMFLQQKLSPTPSMDPMHQKVMTFLPIIFTLFFAFFPAGLVLYWLVNNLLSITQQWYIMNKFDKASKKA